MSGKLEKLIKLIGQTGDRLIIYDPKEELDPYVIMSLDAYQRLFSDQPLGLTENDLADKINPDIENWPIKDNLPESKPVFDNFEVDELADDFADETASEAEEFDNSETLAEERSFESLLESVLVDSDEMDVIDEHADKSSPIANPFTPVGSILENRAKNIGNGPWSEYQGKTAPNFRADINKRGYN